MGGRSGSGSIIVRNGGQEEVPWSPRGKIE